MFTNVAKPWEMLTLLILRLVLPWKLEFLKLFVLFLVFKLHLHKHVLVNEIILGSEGIIKNIHE